MVGWADTHDHLDAHQGFGGLDGNRTYMGVPGSGPTPTDELVFSAHRQLGTSASRPHNAYMQDVRDAPSAFHRSARADAAPARSTGQWPAGSACGGPPLTQDIPSGLKNMFSAFHEQFQITELHRAWEGGMRLISSLAINNAAMEYLMGTPSAPTAACRGYRMPEMIAAHVEAMRQLAADNGDWMQIVYSPTEAQQVSPRASSRSCSAPRWTSWARSASRPRNRRSTGSGGSVSAR